MKQVKEEQLLLAVGEVGDDLLLRAEKTPKRYPVVSKFGAMAACFVLVAGLAIPNVMDSLKMGSNSGSFDNSMVGASDDAMHVTEDGGDPGSNDMDLFTDQGLFLGEEKHAAAVLSLLGIRSAEDVVSLCGERTNIETTSKENAPAEGAQSDGTENLRGTTAQEWYDMLLQSEIVLAEKDVQEIEFLMEVEITLASGEMLTGEYAPKSGALQIGEYRFYNKRFSELF